MKPWKVILVSTLVTLALGGAYLFVVWRHRQNPGVAGQQAPAEQLTQDDVAIVRAFTPQHYEDLARLENTTAWVKDGYVIPYFPYAGGRVNFARQAGLIPPMQKLAIAKVIKAAVPASVEDGMAHGTRQALVVFSLPDAPDPKAQFALPVGAMEGADEAYFTDNILFYDDPHTIYTHWPAEVWAAVAAHQVKPGMNELQARLAVGQKMELSGQQEGNRTITFHTPGKTWTVAFAHDQATTIKTE